MSRKLYDRAVVLDAALDLAKEIGLEKLSIRGVARQLGTSVSPVYDSFESKEALIQGIIGIVIDQNAAQSTYLERNHDILSFGLRYPVLYRDIQIYTRTRTFDTTHPTDIMKLMKADTRYKDLPESALRSLNFDLLLYISGLVHLRQSDSEGEKNDGFYYNALDAASELLLMGYKQAIKEELK